MDQNDAVEFAKGFFCQMPTPHSEMILMELDIITMTALTKFGKRMISEAQEIAAEELLLGRELNANAIAMDIRTIQKNLNALEGAYRLAMN